VRESRITPILIVGISTDKACKPVNVMGMTKALQERVLLAGNLGQSRCDLLCVRYGNVLASRGSVVPLFIDQIRTGGPVTITTPDMTRFLLSLDDAVDTIFAAVADGARGEIYVPQAASARVVDVAAVLIDGRPIDIQFSGIRPGEKIHEVLVSEEEASRATARGRYYVVESILPELRVPAADGAKRLDGEYASNGAPMTKASLRSMLDAAGFIAATRTDRQVTF
jgi:UDP-glucose 4-epimerase